MSPIAAVIIVLFFAWLAWDIIHTPISKDEEDYYDPRDPDHFI